MNIYFLLEDSKSLLYVLPEWLRILLPDFEECNLLTKLEDNQYCIESGYGYPAIDRHFKKSLELLYSSNISLDYFVLVYDADDESHINIQRKKSEYEKIFNNSRVNAKFHIIVIRKCFETWLMGNRNVYPYNNENFRIYEQFFNAALKNPEDMGRPENEKRPISLYHYKYFQEMLRNSVHKNYSKGKPRYVSNEKFLLDLINRIDTTDDLQVFKQFIDIIKQVKSSVPKNGEGM